MEDTVVAEIELDDDQQTAVTACCDLVKRIVAVTGVAGTGKTTIIKTVAQGLSNAHVSVVLAAPTGKAARRITEATGIPAITIHKLLEYNRPGERDEKTGKPLDTTRPKRTRENPLDYRVVIIDEYAMVNHELNNNLMAALPPGGCIRVFGDVNQLPPIEEYRVTNADGSTKQTPFQKLLERPHSIRLEHVYRQGEGSNVLDAANKIRKGHTPPIGGNLPDFAIVVTDRPIDALKLHVKKSLEVGIDYSKIENQIITPTKKTWVGTQKLNGMLRMILNPNPAQTVELERHKWDKEGCTIGINDKVVCTSNTYDMRPFNERYAEWTEEGIPIIHSYIPCPITKQMLNGETGIVTQIYPDGGLDIDFGDRIVEIPIMYEEYWSKRDSLIDVCPMKDIDLAYALTTHKCQGSEFQQVCYILNKSSLFTQSRQNFYTGVTRAAKRAFIFTDQRSLRISLNKVV